ncbi:MAG: hypothetical protein IIB62_11560 [Proteobacteria bacterium]|nr:hypothetical protein [Pseudomonadota bacterium]
MSKNKTASLDEAVEAVRALPQGSQDAIAQELVAMVEDYSMPERPAEEQELIKQRLKGPRKAISRADFMAMLRQYNPAL